MSGWLQGALACLFLNSAKWENGRNKQGKLQGALRGKGWQEEGRAAPRADLITAGTWRSSGGRAKHHGEQGGTELLLTPNCQLNSNPWGQIVTVCGSSVAKGIDKTA